MFRSFLIILAMLASLNALANITVCKTANEEMYTVASLPEKSVQKITEMVFAVVSDNHKIDVIEGELRSLASSYCKEAELVQKMETKSCQGHLTKAGLGSSILAADLENKSLSCELDRILSRL